MGTSLPNRRMEVRGEKRNRRLVAARDFKEGAVLNEDTASSQIHIPAILTFELRIGIASEPPKSDQRKAGLLEAYAFLSREDVANFCATWAPDWDLQPYLWLKMLSYATCVLEASGTEYGPREVVVFSRRLAVVASHHWGVVLCSTHAALNHSCDANTKGDETGRLIATKDILRGEEITLNYSGMDVRDDAKALFQKHGFICRCPLHTKSKRVGERIHEHLMRAFNGYNGWKRVKTGDVVAMGPNISASLDLTDFEL